MTSNPDRIVVDPAGAVVTSEAIQRRLRPYAGTYRLLSDAMGMILLRRELPHEAGASVPVRQDAALLDSGALDVGNGEARVMLAGEILGRMTLFQMIEIIAERAFQGDLVVQGADGSTQQLRFDQGALKDARSDHDEDRLGQVLVREGVLTAEQLVELLWEVTPQRRLGQVCLERNVLEREALFDCLRRQTEGIFYRTLLVADGSFVFTTPDPSRAPPAVTLHLPVRPLLMHGIQRLDEMELYREVIPGGDVCLQVREGEAVEAKVDGLDAESRAVVASCDGRRTLAKIGEDTGLSEYEVTRIAYHLVRGRIVEILHRQAVDNDAVADLVDRFNAVLADIFAAIDARGQSASALQMLGAWVQGCGYDSILGETVVARAQIDLAAVREWVAAAREENPIASVHHVAHELASFAMFCAGSSLPREDELRLSRDVNARLQAIRLPT